MAIDIGFIGLGQMGRWIALNILKENYKMTVVDIDPKAVRRLSEQGAREASTPAALATQVDVILMCLPNTAVVESVLFSEDGLFESLRCGQTVVDLGTTGYQATLEFEKKLVEKGVAFADAPVSGMETRAKEGILTVMFGGEEEVFNRLYPIMDSFGKLILHMGSIGSGQLTKLINQLLFNISAAAIAEILPMAAKLGLDAEKVLSVVTTGTGNSYAAECFGCDILKGDFTRGYPLKNAYKDMISAAEICAYQKIPLPLVHAATTTYQMALAAGYGDEGKCAMIKVFENILGVEFRGKS